MLSTIESSFGNIEPPIQAHPVGAGNGFASRSLRKPLWFPKPKLPVSDVDPDPDPVGSGFIWVILLLNIKNVLKIWWLYWPGSGLDPDPDPDTINPDPHHCFPWSLSTTTIFIPSAQLYPWAVCSIVLVEVTGHPVPDMLSAVDLLLQHLVVPTNSLNLQGRW